MSVIKTIKHYINWRVTYFGRPHVFPFFCDTGSSKYHPKDLRHYIGKDQIIAWDLKNDESLPHYDHIEMSGFYVSTIISYGVNKDKTLKIFKHLIFPMLRKIPNETSSSFSHNIQQKNWLGISVNGKQITNEYVERITTKGYLEIRSNTNEGIEITRKIIPSVNFSAIVEKVTLKNISKSEIKLEVKSPNYTYNSNPKKGVSGTYVVRGNLADAYGNYSSESDNSHSWSLKQNESQTCFLVFSAMKENNKIAFNVIDEEQHRTEFINRLFSTLVLETPNPILNTAFNFAKIRGCESIFKTKGGLMHAPGGGNFYAALWTNDQCEYINPLFPFVGYEVGNEEAINSYCLFMERMGSDYGKALVSSIIAEGEGFWNGAGDRGDAAMYAYGASRFCLAFGDEGIANKLWKGIEWALEYSKRKKNEHGIILSDSDELENRFESGNANLFTSCLLYDAYQSAAMLGKELNKAENKISEYENESAMLRKSIENYFGGNVEGFETYKYYSGNKVLRAWICIPLTMGIYDRAEETIEALFSEKLWTNNGLKTQSDKETFWDRSTLYALRGVFTANKSDLALKHLEEFSNERLLGEHVPYSVEAYPEGNQAHLSAESGLYARVYTEGLFGIRPTGFKTFICSPHLPETWERASLRNIRAFKSDFNIEVSREDNKIRLKVFEKGNLIFNEISEENHEFHVKLKA